jgi:hypothetical protein
VQRRDEDSDEQAATAAPRIISRHQREAESSDEEVEGDVARRGAFPAAGTEGARAQEPEEDEAAIEARRAAVRERCVGFYSSARAPDLAQIKNGLAPPRSWRMSPATVCMHALLAGHVSEQG